MDVAPDTGTLRGGAGTGVLRPADTLRGGAGAVAGWLVLLLEEAVEVLVLLEEAVEGLLLLEEAVEGLLLLEEAVEVLFACILRGGAGLQVQ